MGLQRVRYDWVINTHSKAQVAKEQSALLFSSPVLLLYLATTFALFTFNLNNQWLPLLLYDTWGNKFQKEGGSSLNITHYMRKEEKPLDWSTKGWKVKVKSLSRVWLFATPWTVAHQPPLSMEFFRQEYWSGLLFPSPGDLPNPGIEPGSPVLQADALSSELSHYNDE